MESQEDFITVGVFGKMIYDNFVFDIAKIMDICTLFYLVTFSVPIPRAYTQSLK